MSLVNLAHVCSQIQNASRRKLVTTPVISSKMILSVMLALQNQGFISSVTRGTVDGPDVEYTPTVQENVARRRLWIGLKYYDNEPVLSRLNLISKPTRRIHMDMEGLQKLIKGEKAGYVEGVRPGECIFLSTDRGIMELREAIDRQIGGQLLCRAM